MNGLENRQGVLKRTILMMEAHMIQHMSQWRSSKLDDEDLCLPLFFDRQAVSDTETSESTFPLLLSTGVVKSQRSSMRKLTLKRQNFSNHFSPLP